LDPPDFDAIAKAAYAQVEEARAQRRREAEARVARRFATANTSIYLMSEHDRERAISLEERYDRTCRLVVRSDGSVTIGQPRYMKNLASVVASAGVDAVDPSGLASELLHSFEHAQHLFQPHKTRAQKQQEWRLNSNLGLGI
jgi:hypothetical protein